MTVDGLARGRGGRAPFPHETMHYSLASGISFCRVAGRFIFLDVPRDRYFCLSAESERCFAQLVDGESLSQREHAVLAQLVAGRILKDAAEEAVPLACQFTSPVRQSLLDTEQRPPALPHVLAAAFSLASAPARLRLLGFDRLLQETARRKGRGRDLGTEQLSAVAFAFDRLRLVATAHDRCLVRSIAAARRLIALGGRPDLVIGVKLQPFKAHCWVQHGPWLVNDRTEVVRDFTPILVV
ncbi:lasso peptide biosynthesis B2 protein [Allosphingosinicella sp.]|uniref:lasso peptide biosynthesis B2 protein n=1 Tax=Allosphingosinicella sp. TaxID=2823234 RepID=UPI002FC1F9BE